VPDPETLGHVRDTAKLLSVLLLVGLTAALMALGVPAVPTVVLAVCAGLLVNGFERAATKRDLWPD
jgi:hypothetical protein